MRYRYCVFQGTPFPDVHNDMLKQTNHVIIYRGSVRYHTKTGFSIIKIKYLQNYLNKLIDLAWFDVIYMLLRKKFALVYLHYYVSLFLFHYPTQ